MSAGMSAAWRAKQNKQKRCDRCELYTPATTEKCIHCSSLNNVQLIEFKAQHNETLEHNAMLGKYLFIVAVIIGSLLFLTFL